MTFRKKPCSICRGPIHWSSKRGAARGMDSDAQPYGQVAGKAASVSPWPSRGNRRGPPGPSQAARVPSGVKRPASGRRARAAARRQEVRLLDHFPTFRPRSFMARFSQLAPDSVAPCRHRVKGGGFPRRSDAAVHPSRLERHERASGRTCRADRPKPRGVRRVTWQDCALGDVITLKRGHDLPERKRVSGPVPVVSSSGISGSHNEARANPPGVVTGRYGTIGEVFFVEKPYWPLNTALYVIDFKGNDPRFVVYLLRNTLRNYKTEKAAVPGVDRNVLHALRVRAPSPNEPDCRRVHPLRLRRPDREQPEADCVAGGGGATALPRVVRSLPLPPVTNISTSSTVSPRAGSGVHWAT